MNSIKIAINNIRKWSNNPRIYIIGILIVIFSINYVYPLVLASKDIGYRFTPWLFPFLVNHPSIQRIIMLGIIFLFCDAPFLDKTQVYTIIRSNRKQWAIGQIYYIIIASGLYLLLINISSLIISAKNIYISNEWGKVFSTFANTNAGDQFGINYINYNIISNFTPIEATFSAFIIEWLIAIFLGLIIFILNMYLKRGLGAIIASFIVLLDTYISLGSMYLCKISPVSFARLSILDESGISQQPSIKYVFLFMIISNLILSIISVTLMRYKDIDTKDTI